MNHLSTRKLLHQLVRVAVIFIGSLIFAIGVALFLDPLAIAPGGLSGVAIILHTLLPLETGMIYLVMNIPMFLLGSKRFGRDFLFGTVFATVLISILTDTIAHITRNMPLITDQELLASMVGSACTALGAGIIFRCGCTTGGMDILVKVLRTKFPHIKSGVFTTATDALVVMLSAVVFQNLEKALISTIGIIIYGFVLDQVLYRTDEATMLFIVSKQYQRIAQRLLTEVNIGATFLPATGAYTGQEQEILLCVAHKRLYAKVRQIIREEDPAAFTMITNANEVYGEGFKDQYSIEM
jgi:uncharacterized membrane-anchored protein YitT (DUF2179 family)